LTSRRSAENIYWDRHNVAKMYSYIGNSKGFVMLRFVVAIATLVALLAFGPAFAEEMKMNRIVSMTGHGEVRAVPDTAQVSVGVTSFGNTAREALTANTTAMTNLMAVLLKTGIEKRDITTSNFNVGPRYVNTSNDGSTPAKISGYDVTNTVTINVRKIESLGDVLDQAVSAGSNQVYGISFSVTDADKKLDEARKDAIADAKRKAELYAGASGFSIGEVVSVIEGGGGAPMPVVYARAKSAEMSADVPMSQGEQVLGVDVSVVWEIKK
jgi:uncharacterized protein